MPSPQDDDRDWRCKACGARQPDPEPPCERCWNATFVSGDGADRVAGGPDDSPSATAAQVRHVKATTGRSATLSGVAVLALFGVRESVALATPFSTFTFALLWAAGALTAVFLAVAVVAATADAFGVVED